MKSTDSLNRRVQRLEDERESVRNAPPGVVAYLERQDGKATREYLEGLAATGHWPEWPPWPREADGYHHAWVREHWTVEAADLFDFLHLAVADVSSCAAEVLADEVYAGESLADAFAAAGLDAPPDGYAGTARDHLEATRGAHSAERFDSHLAKMRSFGAKWPTQPPKFREQNREWLAKAERILREPTDDERARIMERRGVGIRGEGYDWRAGTTHYQDLAKAAGALPASVSPVTDSLGNDRHQHYR